MFDYSIRDYFTYGKPLSFDSPLRIDRGGFDYGLSVIIDHDIDDYAFSYYSFLGTIVYLFASTDFLDEATGGLIQRMCQANEEVFISVDIMPVTGSKLMKSVSPDLRECLFTDEHPLRE